MIDLNPNFALGGNALGWARIFIGRFAEALDPLHVALRLSPNDPLNDLFRSFVAHAHGHRGNREEALHHSERAASLRLRYFTLVVQLASLGQVGRPAEARSVLAELTTGAPPMLPDIGRSAFPTSIPITARICSTASAKRD